MLTVADDDQVKSTHDVAYPTFLMVAPTAGAKEALMRLITNITIIGNSTSKSCYFVYDILSLCSGNILGISENCLNEREVQNRSKS